MPAIAASDVTVTVSVRDRLPFNKKRRVQLSVAFGNGALTYPTGGVPMPAFGIFGMKRNLDYINIIDATGSGFEYRYDKTNNKIKMYNENENATYLQRQQLSEIQSTVAPAAVTLQCEAVGW